MSLYQVQTPGGENLTAGRLSLTIPSFYGDPYA